MVQGKILWLAEWQLSLERMCGLTWKMSQLATSKLSDVYLNNTHTPTWGKIQDDYKIFD